MSRAARSVIAVGMLFHFANLSAQEPPPIKRGARVRVTHTCASRRGQGPVCSKYVRRDVGTYRSIRDDTLRYELKSPFRRVKVPLDGVRSIEVVQDHKRRWLSGMGIGVFTGATLGIAIGVAVTDHEPHSPFPNMGPAYGLAIGVPAGMIAGAIIGSFKKDEEWEEVLVDRLRVGFAPQRGGRFTLGVRLAF